MHPTADTRTQQKQSPSPACKPESKRARAHLSVARQRRERLVVARRAGGRVGPELGVLCQLPLKQGVVACWGWLRLVQFSAVWLSLEYFASWRSKRASQPVGVGWLVDFFGILGGVLLHVQHREEDVVA